MSDPVAPEAEKEPSSPVLVGTLTFAGLMSGLLIVGAWQLTLPAITAHKAESLKATVFEVVPGAASIQRLAWDGGALVAKEAPATQQGPAEPVVYGAYDQGGKLLGYAVPAEGPGFQDTISLLYGYDPDSKTILGMRVLDSRETPGLGDKIFKDLAFVGAWAGLPTETVPVIVGKGKKTEAHQVEAISGATISSKAVMRIITTSHAEWTPRLPLRADAPAPAPSAAAETP
ncbi:FMN-binding protein [Myxococcota bacterium]|nr:FMN-binding protein [Myxococcota bacterium]